MKISEFLILADTRWLANAQNDFQFFHTAMLSPTPPYLFPLYLALLTGRITSVMAETFHSPSCLAIGINRPSTVEFVQKSPLLEEII